MNFNTLVEAIPTNCFLRKIGLPLNKTFCLIKSKLFYDLGIFLQTIKVIKKFFFAFFFVF